jgi:hypothetical protein
VSRVDCFHSFIKGERERERSSSSSVFVWGFHFCAVKSQKKRRKMDGQPSPLLHPSAVTSTPSITLLSLDIDIARADATARSTRPPRNRTTRALRSRNVDLPFGLDVFASTQFAKPFPFRAVFRDRKMAFQSKALWDDDTKMRASHPPFFWSTRPTRPTRDSKKRRDSFSRALHAGGPREKRKKGKARRTTVLCSRVKRQNKGGLFDGAFGQKHVKK